MNRLPPLGDIARTPVVLATAGVLALPIIQIIYSDLFAGTTPWNTPLTLAAVNITLITAVFFASGRPSLRGTLTPQNETSPLRWSGPNDNVTISARTQTIVRLSLVPLALLFWVACQVIGKTVSYLWPDPVYLSLQESLAALEAGPLIAVMIISVILAPVGEEVLMRGWVYPQLRRNLTPWLAGIISATLFGLLHQNLTQFVVTVPLGILAAMLWERTRSVLWPILLHVVFNGLALLGLMPPLVETAAVPLLIAATLVIASILWTAPWVISRIWATVETTAPEE